MPRLKLRPKRERVVAPRGRLDRGAYPRLEVRERDAPPSPRGGRRARRGLDLRLEVRERRRRVARLGSRAGRHRHLRRRRSIGVRRFRRAAASEGGPERGGVVRARRGSGRGGALDRRRRRGVRAAARLRTRRHRGGIGEPALEVLERKRRRVRRVNLGGAVRAGPSSSPGLGLVPRLRAPSDAEDGLELGAGEHGPEVGRGGGGGGGGIVARDDAPDDGAREGFPERPGGAPRSVRRRAPSSPRAGEPSPAVGHLRPRRRGPLQQPPRARPADGGRAPGKKRRRHREDALAAPLAVLAVPPALGDLPLLIPRPRRRRGVAELRHGGRVREVHELRDGEHRAALLGEDAVQIRRPDEVARVEHHLRRLAVRGDDEAPRAEGRRPAVADHRDAVAQLEVSAGVQVHDLALRHGTHQQQGRDPLERDGFELRVPRVPHALPADGGVERLYGRVGGDFGKLTDQRFLGARRRLQPRLERLERGQTRRLGDVLQGDVELQALEPAVRVALQRREHPPVRPLVLLHQLDRALAVVPPRAVLARPREPRDAQALRRGFEVQTDVDAVEPAAVLRRRDPQRARERGERPGVEAELTRDGARGLEPTRGGGRLEDAAADARVRRGGLDETLEAAPGDEPGDGRDGAEVRTAEVQRRVARAEPAGIAGRRVRICG